MNAEQIIEHLELSAHPEGGYFKETYRSEIFLDEAALPEFPNGRNIATLIYFLLKSGEKSAFHRLRSDEFWYYHQGSPLEVFIIYPDGRLQRKILGNDLPNDQNPQLLLPAGTWFAARCIEDTSFTLLSCSVSPGFDFSDFELAERDVLCSQFPEHYELIAELT